MPHALSHNAMKIVSYLAKNPGQPASINQLARLIGISVGSAHHILKGLETEDIVQADLYGNSLIYRLNKSSAKALGLMQTLSQGKTPMAKKTKIVCTIGPASNTVSQILKLVEEGMDVARINGAHGDESSFLEMIKNLRKASSSIGILLDLPGTKMRIVDLEQEVPVIPGQKVLFAAASRKNAITVDQVEFPRLLKSGRHFSIDDGSITFIVENIRGGVVHAVAQNKGIIKNRKGVIIPDIKCKAGITQRDKELIAFAIRQELNFIGFSFVNSAEDVLKLEQQLKGTKLKIVSKIETKKAIENYREIIQSSYAIMIDRGDLGSDVPFEQLPRLQKRVIQECNGQGKPVIIATEMMHSMVSSPVPKKSEITDVANAVLDGASAVMLSAETAVGQYPLEPVRAMRKIIQEIEGEVAPSQAEGMVSDDTGLMGSVVLGLIQKGSIDKVLCITHGGFTARMLSRFKLPAQIIALTSDPKIVQRLSLVWGVVPLLVEKEIDNTASVEQKKEAIVSCLRNGLIDVDDTILLVGAVFPNHRKVINMVELHRVSEIMGFFGIAPSEINSKR